MKMNHLIFFEAEAAKNLETGERPRGRDDGLASGYLLERHGAELSVRCPGQRGRVVLPESAVYSVTESTWIPKTSETMYDEAITEHGDWPTSGPPSAAITPN